MRIQTLLAFDAAGVVVDAFDIYEGKRHSETQRLIKKQLKARRDVARVQRITTHTLDGSGHAPNLR